MEPTKKRLPFQFGEGSLPQGGVSSPGWGVTLVFAVPGLLGLSPRGRQGILQGHFGCVGSGPGSIPLPSLPTDLPEVLAGVPEVFQQGAPAAGEVSR